MRRRAFLGAGVCAAAVTGPLAYLFARREPPSATLVADPAKLLDLPPGFSYRVLGRSFDRMSDGFRAPASPDGMACFAGPDGTWILMRNHELTRNPKEGAFGGPAPAPAYDSSAQGGVSRLVLDPKSLSVRSSNMVLAGTLRNCAGGPSPWGWLSCEEATDEGHGYVFPCPIDQATITRVEPLRGYGRFRHEAAAVDPRTLIAYLTEDEGDGCLYRFVPEDPNRPFTGTLQALQVIGEPGFSTSERMSERKQVPVTWVTVPDPDASATTVRSQAHRAGAAVIRRGEGIWYHEGHIYLTATSGGRAGLGQVFRLRLASQSPTPANEDSTEILELVAESTGRHELDCPDNITVAPWGDVFVAEDGSGDQYIRRIDAEGRVHDVARNAHSDGELAGVCFSPDGSTLFFNLQHDGITVAVRGPWSSLGA